MLERDNMSSRSVRDSQLDTSGTWKTLRLPVVDIDAEFPSKGNFAYNRPDEVGGVDGVLYYADGTKWIPLLSGSGNNLIAGPGISIVAGGGNVTISNIATLAGIGTNPNGALIPNSPQSPPSYTVRGLLAGTGISLSISATDVTITNTAPAGPDVTLTSAGGDQTLVVDGTGPTLSIKGLTAGEGITIDDNGTFLTINNALLDYTFVGLTTITPNAGLDFVDGYGLLTSPFVIPSNAFDIFVTASGGGGGGGAGDIIGGGGAGAGVLLYKLQAQAGETLSFIVGGGGAGGVAAGGTGGNGSPTTVSLSVSLPYAYQISGGLGGGIGADNIAGVSFQKGFALFNGGDGGNGGSAGGGGNGQPFANSIGGLGGAAAGGNGGGGGGGSYIANGGNGGAGNNGVTDGGVWGSGGGGSGSGAPATVNGGAGGTGFVIIEYKLPV